MELSPREHIRRWFSYGGTSLSSILQDMPSIPISLNLKNDILIFNLQHILELGDEIFVTSNAPHLNLFEGIPDPAVPVKSPQTKPPLAEPL